MWQKKEQKIWRKTVQSFCCVGEKMCAVEEKEPKEKKRKGKMEKK